jgi:hypothetical protein
MGQRRAVYFKKKAQTLTSKTQSYLLVKPIKKSYYHYEKSLPLIKAGQLVEILGSDHYRLGYRRICLR